jgi:hypothetical protein
MQAHGSDRKMPAMTRIYAFFGHEQWPPSAVLRWTTLAEDLSAFPAAARPAEMVRVDRPLVDDLGADVVVAQLASTGLESTLRMFADEVLPELRR